MCTVVCAIDAALAPAGSAWLAIEKRRDSQPERDELLTALQVGGFTVTEVLLPSGLGPKPCVCTVAVYRCERDNYSSKEEQTGTSEHLESVPQPEPEPGLQPEPELTAAEESESLRQARVNALNHEHIPVVSNAQAATEENLLSDLD